MASVVPKQPLTGTWSDGLSILLHCLPGTDSVTYFSADIRAEGMGLGLGVSQALSAHKNCYKKNTLQRLPPYHTYGLKFICFIDRLRCSCSTMLHTLSRGHWHFLILRRGASRHPVTSIKVGLFEYAPQTSRLLLKSYEKLQQSELKQTNTLKALIYRSIYVGSQFRWIVIHNQ